MTTPMPDQLAELSLTELRRRANDYNVSGRSRMNKAELITALTAKEPQLFSRVEQFSEFARQRATAAVITAPENLDGYRRRRHVRQTIREDHQSRIAQGNAEAHAKFDKLADSLYAFFRGTCLLFYRDMAGADSGMPTVLTLGDVHPGNFGVMPSEDNVPIFGVNDFDEAYYAPFTWDLKRGAVGFWLGAAEQGGLGNKHRRKIVRAFLEGYIDAIREYARNPTEQDLQLRQDNAPKIIRKLIEDEWEARATYLERKYVNEDRTGFRADEEHVPISSRTEEFQEILNAYVDENDIDIPPRAGELRVKDVCERLGQGVASLGLPRYYLMIEGPQQDGTDDLLLEFKQARPSALHGLVPPSDFIHDGQADRITHAQGVHLVRGDRFFGAVEVDGLSFMVRERAPFRGDIDLDDLSAKKWRKYARVCGASLAQAHALSDDVGLVDHDVEPNILAAIGPVDLFLSDLIEFAQESAARLRADHEYFKMDHDLGAFTHLDRTFR